MNATHKCSQCGTELPPGVPESQCPRCLLREGMGTQPDAAATEPVPPPKPPPSIAELAPHFPQLEILELLGQGGMGVVYKARQPRLDRLVALKILPADPTRAPSFAERFTREARAMAALSHPHIVAVYDFGETEGIYFFIMEYVDGLNLRQLEQAGKLTSREALKIVPAICEALQYAHDQGIVHRDIKPDNILVDKLGRVKIADFGLAKLLGQRGQQDTLTAERQIMGTPHYMAPEQMEDPQHVDHRADIYSLGVVFYEMLTGELPIGRFAPPSEKVQVDVRLDEVVLRSLEKERARRYQHASQVKSDVENITSSASTAPKTAVLADSCAAARHSIRGPAIGLIITGVVNWLMVPVLGLFLTYQMARAGAGSKGPIVLALFMAMAASTFILFAGFKMRALEAWVAAVIGSILAMITTPGNVIGLPMGTWALVTLTRRSVRDAFRLRPSVPPPVATPPPPADRARRLFFATATICLMGVALLVLLVIGGLFLSITLPAFVRAREHARDLAIQKGQLRQYAGNRVLRAFNVQDQTLSQNLVVTNGAWLIDSSTNQVVHLFELPNPDVDDKGRLICRGQLKSDGLEGRAYLQVRYTPLGGGFGARGLSKSVSGWTGWTPSEATVFLEAGKKPASIELDLVLEGAGRVWVRDLALLKSDG